jgi:NADH-quinone oxidoreductase subunit C
VTQLSSTDAPPAEAEPVDNDDAREGILAELTSELGDALVGSHIAPGLDITVRVTAAAWADTAAFLKTGLGFAYFSFLSAIDWMPSPFGRDMDSQVDLTLEGTEPKEQEPIEPGLTGGDTRFQVLARVNDVVNHRAVTLKADVPEPDLTVPSWVHVYAGANWHEREAWEMFGISFEGHPGLRHIYLPGEFEGNPLRKDFPLLARRVKPWPGIVDVEAMPGSDEDEETSEGDAASADPANAGDNEADS